MLLEAQLRTRVSSCSISMITTAHANVRARSPRLRGVELEELNPFAVRMFAKFERGPTVAPMVGCEMTGGPRLPNAIDSRSSILSVVEICGQSIEKGSLQESFVTSRAERIDRRT